jgi:hypothetical protein
MDGRDAEETRNADKLLRTIRPAWQRGIDGQITNPTLVAKNPEIQKYLASGKSSALSKLSRNTAKSLKQ